MNTKTLILTSLIVAPLALAGGEHDHSGHDHKPAKGDQHDHHVTAGPNGGHVVNSTAGVAFEIVVDKQRKARITRLDAHGKAVAPGELSIHGIAGPRSAPTKLRFVRGAGEDDGVLVSDKALPEGQHLSMILMVKAAADAKPSTERFELHLH